jgi:glucose/mannose transport system substrate-binding protein
MKDSRFHRGWIQTRTWLGWASLTALGLLLAPAVPAQPNGVQVDVLHWWTSASERKAADVLSAHLAQAGVQWKDAAIPGGGGMAAVKVLKSRVLMGDPPDVAQLIGTTLTDWADIGLVLPLNAVAQRQRWSQVLFPTVLELVSYKGEVIAAPLGIQRINTLLYNRKVFARLGLPPPRSWAEFEAVARKLQAQGITPLAWSDEPWQIATVFETLLLGDAGPALYRELIVQRKGSAWMNPRVARALTRLRWLRTLATDAPVERPWTDSAHALMTDAAAMLIMGDWAKGELQAWGASPAKDFGCVVVPGTEGMHLYSIDTLAMLVSPRQREAAQEKVAEVVASIPTQMAYSRQKGAVPVRRDIDPTQLDPCARDSWETFAAPRSARLPSLAHRMAADEAIKDAVAQTLWRYLTDARMEPQEAQRRLAAVIRAPSAERREHPAMNRTLLVVDDDQKTRNLLKTYLEKHQYAVRVAHDGASFMAEFERFKDELSLVILDVMLPDTDGFTLCQNVRKQSSVPIIMLTASADDTDRIVGLELGADDYIAKPYNPRELLARIKAIHRRMSLGAPEAPVRCLRFAGFCMDVVERVLTDPQGQAVVLTSMDFNLLRFFAEHAGETLDRTRLMEQTRGRDLGPLDRSLDVQISRLRQRLHDDGKQPALIKTVRGSGYVFSADVSAHGDA